MPIILQAQQCPFPLPEEVVSIINQLLQTSPADHAGGAVIINFKDPSYSVETGGCHPVEMRILESGVLEYITDFSLVGQGDFAELIKEVDFDFSQERFSQAYIGDWPLEEGREFFQLYMSNFISNFISYYYIGVYEVTVTNG